MEHVNNDHGDAKEIDINEWVVVKTMGGGYLGKPRIGVTLSKVASPNGGDNESLKKFKARVFDIVSSGDSMLELCPCFDFMAPLRPVQNKNGQVAFARDPVIVPFDFTTYATSVYVKATGIMFCADTQGKDRELYKSFVQQTLDMAIKARFAASGLELAGRMPPER